MELLDNPEFWVAVAFVIAVSLMWWKGSGAITGMLDNRASRISAELDEARSLREEAAKTLAEYQKRQAEALTEAQEITARAEAEMTRLAERAAQDMATTIKRREELAHERIAQAEAQALAEVRMTAVDVAISAARELIRTALDQQHGAQLIDDAISDLTARLH